MNVQRKAIQNSSTDNMFDLIINLNDNGMRLPYKYTKCKISNAITRLDKIKKFKKKLNDLNFKILRMN